MIVYKDRAFCMQDCGRMECIRNKQSIPWENQLPVSFIRCGDCINWETLRNMESYGDFYIREDESAKSGVTAEAAIRALVKAKKNLMGEDEE